MEQNLRITEKELHDIKYGSFLDSSFEGERELNQELINLFKTKKRLRDEDIATMLHLSPDDSKSNEIIMKQIEILVDYGLIKRWRGGYQWRH